MTAIDLDGDVTLTPGHGVMSTVGDEPRSYPYVYDAAPADIV